jgi:hypothetical protein
MTIKRNKDIEYGNVNLLDDEFDPKNVKIRVTTLIDEDVLLLLKDYAKRRGNKYQTVLNGLLRAFFDKPTRSNKIQGLSEERVRRIVQEEIRKRA